MPHQANFSKKSTIVDFAEHPQGSTAGERSPPNPKSKKRYCSGASQIHSGKEKDPEDIWDFCLTSPDDAEELDIEYSRDYRIP
jgi:hypothetical protein